MHVKLTAIAVDSARCDVVQIDSITELASFGQEGWDVGDQNTYDGSFQFSRIDTSHEILDDWYAIQLVTVQGRRQSEHRTIYGATGDNEWNADRLAESVVNHVEPGVSRCTWLVIGEVEFSNSTRRSWSVRESHS